MASRDIIGEFLWISEHSQSLLRWCTKSNKIEFIWCIPSLIAVPMELFWVWPSEIPDAKTAAMASGTWSALLLMALRICPPTFCSLMGQARWASHLVCVLSRSCGSHLSVARGKVWGRSLELCSRKWGAVWWCPWEIREPGIIHYLKSGLLNRWRIK